MSGARALQAVVAALSMVLVACPAPPPPRPLNHNGPAQHTGGPRELLRRVLAKNDGFGTLTTVHQVTAEIAISGERSEKRSFRGVLAVQRPGSFRLQLLGPAGVKLVDLLYLDGKTRPLVVNRDLRRSSRLPAIIDSIAGDIRAIYRLDPQPAVQRRTLSESVSPAPGAAPMFNLKEYAGDKLVRELDIYASTLAIARSQLLERGDVRTITYGEHQIQGNLIVPRRIHVAKQGTVFYWLSIRVESVSLDQELDQELFRPDAA